MCVLAYELCVFVSEHAVPAYKFLCACILLVWVVLLDLFAAIVFFFCFNYHFSYRLYVELQGCVMSKIRVS